MSQWGSTRKFQNEHGELVAMPRVASAPFVSADPSAEILDVLVLHAAGDTDTLGLEAAAFVGKPYTAWIA